MSETKICKDCGVEKQLTEFYLFRNRDGSKSYRNNCKVCFNLKSNRNKPYNQNKPRTENTLIKNNVHKIKDREVKINMFTDKEIERLKELVNDKNFGKVSEYFNDFQVTYKDKQDRTPRTINISNLIFERIKQYSIDQGLNISDIVNSLLSKSIDLLDK